MASVYETVATESWILGSGVVPIGLSVVPAMGVSEGPGCTVEERGAELGPPSHPCLHGWNPQNGTIPEAGGVVRLCGGHREVFPHHSAPVTIWVSSSSDTGAHLHLELESDENLLFRFTQNPLQCAGFPWLRNERVPWRPLEAVGVLCGEKKCGHGLLPPCSQSSMAPKQVSLTSWSQCHLAFLTNGFPRLACFPTVPSFGQSCVMANRKNPSPEDLRWKSHCGLSPDKKETTKHTLQSMSSFSEEGSSVLANFCGEALVGKGDHNGASPRAFVAS